MHLGAKFAFTKRSGIDHWLEVFDRWRLRIDAEVTFIKSPPGTRRSAGDKNYYRGNPEILAHGAIPTTPGGAAMN